MGNTGRVLIAADKFKGSLTAAQVAEEVAAGIREVRPETGITALPVADGGDGTVAAAVAGGFTPHRVEVTGPLGSPVTARYALRGDTAVVEMAQSSGLMQLPPDTFAPLTATTYGTGELILAALDAGARTVVLGVGGSATTDGGAGMLAALGARLLGTDGRPVPLGGGPLATLATADLSGLDGRLAETRVVLAGDVDNPLTGPKGAAPVYAPQKGATADDVQMLDAALGHYVTVLARALGPRARELSHAPGAGAAGGVGYAALLALHAVFRPGIEVFLDLLGFPAALAGADLVVTGEGSLDEQTLHGKAPAGVAGAARAAGKPVVAVCGRLALSAESLRAAGIQRAYPLTDLEPDPAVCIAHAAPLLRRAARQLAENHL
ncbi:glycerate kinase [Streptomyces aidingensis]|uniref:Glycerate kinase n=1 Tax=Streptomyces aidingensis TaxID=910347 RepID=A0A1I1IV61_9ACTN|nr:glycerate kinase [Streptomyces aidingensis]SFC40124.1 glycerate kinase [Streptomyces aidingensis]